MAKVVTSQGLTEFVQTGKFDQVTNHKKGQSNEAPPLEAVKEAPTIDIGVPNDSTKTENVAVDSDSKEKTPEQKTTAEKANPPWYDQELTEEEKTLPLNAQKEIKRSKWAVSKKHAEMMESKRELEELERFGETQFNEKRELEKKLAAIETELQALRQQAKQPEPEFKKPDKTDAKYKTEKGEFDWEKFSEDLADYRAELKIREERKRQADERSQSENRKLLERHTSSEEKAKAAHKDFDAVMARIQGTELDSPPGFVLGFLNDSEISGELRYYLATHTDETKKIFGLSPIRGIKELGKIEDSLIKPSEATKETPVASGAIPKGAPPPITPLNGSGSSIIQTDPSKMSFKELREYERSRKKK